MKILIGMTRSDTTASGSFKHIVQIGERFRKEGIAVSYVIGKNGPAYQYLVSRNFKVHELPYLDRELKPLQDIISILQLIFVILKVRPNLCSWHTAKIGALGRVASFLTFRKNYYIPHGVPFYESEHNKGHKKYRLLEKLLGVLPAKIIGVCDYDTQQYRDLGVPENRTLTIHNGMRTVPERQIKTDPKEKVIFVTAARFEDQKDYTTLALATQQLSNYIGRFELHIYGDGRFENEVKTLFSTVPGSVVHFAGVIDDLTTALCKADVFILSSHWEGLPRTIIEAMSCIMPVIASDVGGVSELIEHKNTGYLFAQGDSQTLSHFMRTYIDNHALIAEHGWASYRKFQNEFTLDRMLGQYIGEYLPNNLAARKPVTESVTDA